MPNTGSKPKAFYEEWQRATDNASEHAKGWEADQGEGLLGDEELSQHALVGCLVCSQWDEWPNLKQRPGQHDLVTMEGRS